MAWQLPENGNGSQRQKQADNECQMVRADPVRLGGINWNKSHLLKNYRKIKQLCQIQPLNSGCTGC
jgi:hypothetical protein